MFNRERFWDYGIRAAGRDSISIVEPAFGSRSQAMCFLLLVSTLLALPVLIDRSGLVTRERSYEMIAEHEGGYSYMKKEIFENSGDIDVLFLGSSVLWNGLDTRQFQRSLSDSLGREATVMTFGFNFNGLDTSYAILRDLLERRRVHLVVFTVSRIRFHDGPSTLAYRFLRYSDHPEVVADMPLSSKFSLYACNVLRSPHDILLMLRPDRSRPPAFADGFGSNIESLGMARDPDAFVPFAPPRPTIAPVAATYSADTQDNFKFTNDYPTPHQDLYLHHLVKLLDEKRTPLAIINIPLYEERSNDKVVERFDWSKRYGGHIKLVGIPPTTLFAGLDEQQLELLFGDPRHFNKNGAEYFTEAMLPTLLMTYKDHASKDY